jgi:hypothetical protein
MRFEELQRLGDGGLRHVQHARCTGYSAHLHDGAEYSEMPDVKHEPSSLYPSPDFARSVG